MHEPAILGVLSAGVIELRGLAGLAEDPRPLGLDELVAVEKVFRAAIGRNLQLRGVAIDELEVPLLAILRSIGVGRCQRER
jgi:hypothetical protein